MGVKNYSIYLRHVSNLSKHNYQSIIDRALYKLGRVLAKYFSIQTSLALGYGSLRYLNASRAIGADFYICHQELATYTGIKLIKKGFKVAFDFEDWYSEDLLENAQIERPLRLLQKMEATALKNGIFSTTTSTRLAERLAQTYSSKVPGVIYNVFPSNITLLEKSKAFVLPLKLFWFSQTIGAGRGIEEFICLLKEIKSGTELHLLGNINPAFQKKLSLSFPGQHRLFFHKLVNMEELPVKIAEFDIGLALEKDAPLSRDYTITNKFFQYLQSGLPVIASRTKGQDEGFDRFQPGFKLSQKPSKEEITSLNKWLNDPSELQNARQRVIQAATFYNWENESKKLIQIVAQALENGR
jgi:glycosyltransferase involved in cell wall biosynthesis